MERATAIGATLPRPAARAALDADRRALIALAAIVSASAALGLWFAWRPIDHLVAHSVADDAFYYFDAARNIVHGRGVSVDGEVWANGFHPLWMLLLLPVFAIFRGDAETPVHVALSLSALLTSGSGVLLYAAARRLGLSAAAALVATALYLLHPVVVYMSLNGLETGVNVSTFVLLLFLFVAAYQQPSARTYAFASAAAGLLVLSRTDYAFVALAVAIALFARWRDARAAAALALPALAVTLPWFAWNIAVFGSPLQVSAGAVPYVAHQLFPAADASVWQNIDHALGQLRQGAFTTIPYFYFTPTRATARFAAAFVAIIAALAVAVAWRGDDRTRRTALLLIAVPSAGLAAQFLIHAGVRWYVREWYFVALFPIVALLAALLADAALRSRAPALGIAVLAAVVLAATIPKGVSTYRDGWYGVQLDMLAAARYIDDETPPETRVGAFNSGIVGYFDNRTTVNLDGVMNPDASDAIRGRRLAAYMRERRIDLLADFPFYPFFFYRPFLGEPLPAREIASFNDHPTFQGPFTIYDLTGGGGIP